VRSRLARNCFDEAWNGEGIGGSVLTSEEIKKAATVIVDDSRESSEDYRFSTAMWLQEIAYQLAVHNERNEKLVQRSEDDPGIRERGGDGVTAEFACPIATGYRCFTCKYERTFADLKPEGQHQLEAGLCPACDSSEVGIIFDGPARSTVDSNLGSHSNPIPAADDPLQRRRCWNCKDSFPAREPKWTCPRCGAQNPEERHGFPLVAADRLGRWGVWFGPGPAAQTFESETMARAYLKTVVDRGELGSHSTVVVSFGIPPNTTVPERSGTIVEGGA
jgi:Zn finger protein HypA/HybF involved in hydrogenase expression